MNVAIAKKALIELNNKYDTFVIDIETSSEKDNDFTHANQQKLLCIGIGYSRNKVLVLSQESCYDAEVQKELKILLGTGKIICHNGKFDLSGLASIGKAKLYADTMLMSYVVDERGGTHGLKYLATELIGAPDYELEIKQYVKGANKDYANIPTDLLHKYNAYDVACTWLLYEYFTQRFTDDDRKLHEFLCRVSDRMVQVEMGGIKIDTDTEYLDSLWKEFETELDQRETQLSRWVANPRSPKQVKEALEKLGAKVSSTNEETLLKLQGIAKGQLLEFVEKMLDYRKTHKLFSTYVKGLKSRLYEGRVYPTFLLHGTTTGRLSCRYPNIQNIPRGSAIRRLFVPNKGNVFIQADYSQAELRTIAALASDRYLQGIFQQGRDIHGEVAERFFGPGWTKEQRVKAKMVVFGLAYAMTAQGLARRLNIELSEAQRYAKEFFQVIPDVVEWRESVKRTLLTESEDLITPFGRHRRFGLITKDNQEEIVKEGLAFLPQSIASDICMTAFKGLRHDLHVRNLVHDSIMVECKDDEQDEVAAYLTQEMEKAGAVFTDFVPYKVDVSVSAIGWGDL